MSLLNRNKRGSVLIMVYMVLGVLLVLSSVFFTRIVSDRKLFDIGRERQEAFYLAEAAVDRGIVELKNDWSGYNGTGILSSDAIPLGRGKYKIDVSSGATTSQRKILAGGYILLQPPSTAPNGPVTASACNADANCRAGRVIEAIVTKEKPSNFSYDKAIYSAGDIDLNGEAYSVGGDVIYAGSLSGSTGGITGSVTQDPTISPLAQFDFAGLRVKAETQGNLYTADDIEAKVPYPTDFWYSAPTDPSIQPGPPESGYDGVPNIVYVEGDMTLNGNIGTVGGFFIVVGDVLTDPDDTSDMTINGNGEIDGSIYTTGNFRVNGGGAGLNVNGGVWAGLEVRLNGNATVAYNPYYMNAIKYFIDEQEEAWPVELLSWRELE